MQAPVAVVDPVPWLPLPVLVLELPLSSLLAWVLPVSPPLASSPLPLAPPAPTIFPNSKCQKIDHPISHGASLNPLATVEDEIVDGCRS